MRRLEVERVLGVQHSHYQFLCDISVLNLSLKLFSGSFTLSL